MKAVRFHHARWRRRSCATRTRRIPTRGQARCSCACAPARSIISISGARAGCRTCRFRCRTSPAATSPAKSSPSAARRRADRPPRHAAAGRQLRPLRGLPVGPRQRVPAVRGARLPEPSGGYAEFVKVPVQNLVVDPRRHRLRAAAAFPLTFLTAWHMLMTQRARRSAARRARAGGGQRRRPGGDSDRVPARRARLRHRRHPRRSWSGRERSARTRSSTTTSRTSPRKSSG